MTHPGAQDLLCVRSGLVQTMRVKQQKPNSVVVQWNLCRDMRDIDSADGWLSKPAVRSGEEASAANEEKVTVSHVNPCLAN